MEEDLKEQLEQNEREMNSMKESYEQKLAEAMVKAEELHNTRQMNERAKVCPHLANVNVDPHLTGSLKYIVDLGPKRTKVVIGSADKVDIQLYGLGVADRHAGIFIENGEYFLEPYNNSRVIQNGSQRDEKFQLGKFDRLVFGASQFYIFIDPSKFIEDKDAINEKLQSITAEKIQQEIAEATGLISNTFDRKEPDQMACINQLIDLMPYIEEANQISILLDKKMKYQPIILNPIVIGDPYSKVKVNFTYKFIKFEYDEKSLTLFFKANDCCQKVRYK
jgi:kinesin family protein 1